MPGRGTPPSRLSVGDLWMGIFAWPTFGGLLLGATLVGTPQGGEWGQFWAVLLFGGFFGVSGIVLGCVHLSELARRRERVPAGRAQRILMAVTLTVLFMAAGVAIDFAGVWITGLASGLAMPAWLQGALVGGLAGVLFVSFDRIGRWLARKPPISEGNGGTEPRPPANHLHE